MFSLTVADRAEELVDTLAAALAVPLGDPFAAEWVTVPNLGFRSWLRYRLAESLGVAANVEMPLPGTLRWKLLALHARHLGLPEGPDPWSVDRMVWSVMAVMSDPAADIDDRLRRSALPTGVTLASRAGPIADLFDRYGVHRPDMLRAWAAGHDTGSAGLPLAAEQLWQPGLYRAVVARIAGAAGAVPPPADRLVEAIALVRAGDLTVHGPDGIDGIDGIDGFPARLFVAGPSIVTAELGPVLAALGTQIDVTVLLLAPSAATFRAVADVAPAAEPAATSWGLVRTDATGAVVHHPLLGGWGRRPLDTASMFGAGGVAVNTLPSPPAVPAPAGASPTVLGRVQADLRADRPPTVGPGRIDDSVQVHAAPGPTRQVEVLRDVLLGLLRDHPDLTEADVAVVCPQLDRFAPALAAVLGPSAVRGEVPRPGEVPSLRYSVVDRDARSFNPVLAAMATVLDVLPGRFEVSAVRDLLHAPAVRERFGLTDGDLGLLAGMIDHASVRWGLDGPHRQPWDIDPRHRANSWAAGVDQMLMGVALGEPLLDAVDPIETAVTVGLAVGGLAPMPLREGDIGGAGRVAAALHALARAHARLADTRDRPIGDWVDALTDVADALVAPARYEEWQRARLDAALGELLSAAGEPPPIRTRADPVTEDESDPSGTSHRAPPGREPPAADGAEGPGRLSPAPSVLPGGTPLTLGDVHRLLRPALDEPRSRADLGFGTVVVARPSLLAGVPFRVVAILGLDDNALPNRTPSGDDLMVDEERWGDPDARADARAALLAAVTSARDHLVVTCTSRDIRTNDPVPRAAMLDELVAVVAASAAVAPDEVVVDHPRQGFDPRNYAPAGLDGVVDDAGPFGFDPVAAAGARAVLSRGRTSSGGRLHPLVSVPLPAVPSIPVLALADLLAFFDHPVKGFFGQRLNVSLPRKAEEPDDQLPTGLDALRSSGIGRDLLAVGHRLGDVAGFDRRSGGRYAPEVEGVFDVHHATGILPPGATGRGLFDDVVAEVKLVLELADELGVLRVATVGHDVDVVLDDGTHLVGRVDRCATGERPGPVRLCYARSKPRYELRAAIELLAVAACRPIEGVRSVVVARGAKGTDPPVASTRTMTAGTDADRAAAARRALGELVAQYRDGLRAPLPLFDNTSRAHFDETLGGNPGVADKKWGDPDDTKFAFAKESLDPFHVMAFGSVPFAEIAAAEVAGHRLDDEARRLWSGIDAAAPRADGAKADDGSGPRKRSRR